VCTAIGHVSLLALSASFVSDPGNLVFPPHMVQAAHLHNITTFGSLHPEFCEDIKSILGSGSGGLKTRCYTTAVVGFPHLDFFGYDSPLHPHLLV
jgi:hypothetical protein